MSEQRRLCLILLLLQLVATIMGEELIYEKVVKKPNDLNFQRCRHYMLSAIYTCWDNAARKFQVELDDILKQWPTHSGECCAVWDAHNCFNVKALTYSPCHSPEVSFYNNQVQGKYIENGCHPFTSDKYSCKGATPHQPIWLLSLLSLIGLLIRVFYRQI